MATPAPESVIVRDPEVMSGIPVFRGTRVPVRTMFEQLSAGDSLSDFLERFPGVSRDMALAAIGEAGEMLAPTDSVASLDLREYPALERVWRAPGDSVFDDL